MHLVALGDVDNSSFMISNKVLNYISIGIYVVASFILLSISKYKPEVDSAIRKPIANFARSYTLLATSPLLSVHKVLEDLRDFGTFRKHIRQLEVENFSLRFMVNKYHYLWQENQSLKGLLNFTEYSNLSHKPARVMLDYEDGFSKSFLINKGFEHNVQKWQAVVSKDGLVGRIVEVGNKASRVLLINDTSSKIPVITSISRQIGILTGIGFGKMQILYLPVSHNIQKGELVITTEDVKEFPYGVRVGKVTEVKNGKAFVSPLAKLDQLDYVSVLSFVEEQDSHANTH